VTRRDNGGRKKRVKIFGPPERARVEQLPQ
jgi:hypothetical protein